MAYGTVVDVQGRPLRHIGSAKAQALTESLDGARRSTRDAVQGLMSANGDTEVGTLVPGGTTIERLGGGLARDVVLSRCYAALMLAMAVMVGGAIFVSVQADLFAQGQSVTFESTLSLAVGLAIVAFLGWTAFTVTLGRSDRTALGRIPHLAAAASERLTLGRDRVYHARMVHDASRHYDVRDALEVSEIPYALLGGVSVLSGDFVLTGRDGVELLRLRDAARADEQDGMSPEDAHRHVSQKIG